MDLLWRRHPATAREIEAELPRDNSWAYTTLKTLLARLVEKGAVAEEKRGNVSFYQPLVSRHEAQRTAVESLLGRAFGGAVEPMLNFIASERGLSEEKRRQLLALLDEIGTEKEKS
jgi:predicted transcriptional regulator